MELIKELPAIFEEFGEQRRKSFVTAYEKKQEGVPFVGVFCTYLPQELPMAMGAAVVGLCATSGETIAEAEKDLPRNLCPLIKSSYGFATSDKCPFFYFSDLIVGETTCDGKKKMYEILAGTKPVYIMELPNSQSEDAFVLWKKEVIKFKEKLESHFGVTITEEQIRDAIKLKNEERKALKALYELQEAVPAPILGQDMHKVLFGATFKFDKRELITEIKALTAQIKEDQAQNPDKFKGRPRILLTGCPSGGVGDKVIGAIEDNGGHVVVFENCNGAKSIDEMVDEEDADVYEALARRYLNIGCSCMSPNPNRITLLNRLIDEYQIDGVVDVILQACHTYNVETYNVKKLVTEEKNIPYISLETDYSTSDVGQINTRMAAFVEML